MPPKKGKSHGSMEHQAIISLARAAARMEGWTIEDEQVYKKMAINPIVPDLVVSREERTRQPHGRVTKRTYKYRVEVVWSCDKNLKHDLLGVDDVIVLKVEDYIYLPVYDAMLHLRQLFKRE